MDDKIPHSDPLVCIAKGQKENIFWKAAGLTNGANCYVKYIFYECENKPLATVWKDKKFSLAKKSSYPLLSNFFSKKRYFHKIFAKKVRENFHNFRIVLAMVIV